MCSKKAPCITMMKSFLRSDTLAWSWKSCQDPTGTRGQSSTGYCRLIYFVLSINQIQCSCQSNLNKGMYVGQRWTRLKPMENSGGGTLLAINLQLNNKFWNALTNRNEDQTAPIRYGSRAHTRSQPYSASEIVHIFLNNRDQGVDIPQVEVVDWV